MGSGLWQPGRAWDRIGAEMRLALKDPGPSQPRGSWRPAGSGPLRPKGGRECHGGAGGPARIREDPPCGRRPGGQEARQASTAGPRASRPACGNSCLVCQRMESVMRGGDNEVPSAGAAWTSCVLRIAAPAQGLPAWAGHRWHLRCAQLCSRNRCDSGHPHRDSQVGQGALGPSDGEGQGSVDQEWRRRGWAGAVGVRGGQGGRSLGSLGVRRGWGFKASEPGWERCWVLGKGSNQTDPGQGVALALASESSAKFPLIRGIRIRWRGRPPPITGCIPAPRAASVSPSVNPGPRLQPRVWDGDLQAINARAAGWGG